MRDEKKSRKERPVIGRASATERAPNESSGFKFWLGPQQSVNPFDIVESTHAVKEGGQSKTFGIVSNIEQMTDAPSHLSNYIANDFGNLSEPIQTPRIGANVVTVEVLSNTAEDYMPVQNGAETRFADEEGILSALGIDQVKPEDRIPAGLIEMSNGEQFPVFFERRYLLGPDGAHVNISGISGLATKTSYAMFLIQSILQTSKAGNIAVILLNVKQDDLLHIDKPAEPSLPKADFDRWQRLGLTPREFENTHYLVPWGKKSPGAPNCHGEPPDQHTMYAYALADAADKLDMLINVPDPWATLGPLIGEIQQGLQNREPKWKNIQNWGDLLNNEPLMKNGSAQNVGEVKASSVGRFVRILRRVVQNRQSGLFVSQRSKGVVNLGQYLGGEIKGGHTYVVDIANLTDDEKPLVFGHIIQTVHGLYVEGESDRDLPDKTLIFVDELNKYAPASRRQDESSILPYVIDIAARGRSQGVILISAEQFMSQVNDQVTGNCSTKVIGRSDAAELEASSYRFIPSKEMKNHLTRLDQGDLLVAHPRFRKPIRIKFPRPAYYQLGH
jgi:hypothetical protein